MFTKKRRLVAQKHGNSFHALKGGGPLFPPDLAPGTRREEISI